MQPSSTSQCVSATSTSLYQRISFSLLPPPSVSPLSLSFATFSLPPTFLLLPLCTCLSPVESFYATVPCGDLQLFPPPPATPVLFIQERRRRRSVSELLKTELLDCSNTEGETKKIKERLRGFRYVNRKDSNIVYSEQRKRKKEEARKAEWAGKGGKLEKKKEEETGEEEVKDRTKSKRRYSNNTSQHFLSLLPLFVFFLPQRERRTFLKAPREGEAA